MSKQVFAVLDKNFEYNDEYYYQQGNGDLVGVFPSMQKAKEFANKRGAQLFRSDPEMYFGEEGYNFFYEENGKEMIKAMDDDELAKFIDKNNIELFDIQVIEVTDDFIEEMRK